MADDSWRADDYAGLAAGLRTPLTARVETEIGAGLYIAAPFTASGSIYQYNDPRFNNLNDTYQIQHSRLMLEGKLLSIGSGRYHPYLSVGIGISRLHSGDYQETPTESYAVADPAFTSNTELCLAYSAGLGVDADITEHWRVGGGYEYTHLGTAKLGKAPTQQSAQRLSSGPLHANQFMLQFTYAR